MCHIHTQRLHDFEEILHFAGLLNWINFPNYTFLLLQMHLDDCNFQMTNLIVEVDQFDVILVLVRLQYQIF